jgi:3-phosphoshikimate 1-carboxyvinyltransferase
MERITEPSGINGHIKAPTSKSMTQRAIAASMLAAGESVIHDPSYCDDSLAAMSIAVGLGARVVPEAHELKITGGGILKEPKINCGESGLAIRMFSPIASLFPSEIIMTGANSLRNRPMSMITDALTQFGVRCSTSDGHLPIVIRGPLRGGSCTIDGSVSSQLLTGLLMALPVAPGDSDIRVTNLKSKPYIDLTLEVLRSFGITVTREGYERFLIPGGQKYKPSDFTVEGDWSGGAFLLVAGAINGEIVIEGLRPDSRQSDMGILKALYAAGADIETSGNQIAIRKSGLRAFDFDATESPDLFPPLVALAAYCEGVSTIKGVSRLAHKESDRGKALSAEFARMNISVRTDDDMMFVTGGRPSAAHIDSHDDHRIAMAAAVAALGAEGKVHIRDSHCVAKSYPGFFDDLRTLGAVIHE